MSILEQQNCGGHCACRGTATAAGGGHPRTLTARLERDHREIDAILAEVESLARAGEFTPARQAFATFRRRLDGHIEAEEEILFPVYEQLSACEGLTSVMLGEHANLRRLTGTITQSLETADVSASVQAILALARLLAAHNKKEERFLYPDSDAAFELDAERDVLVARIEERLAHARQ